MAPKTVCIYARCSTSQHEQNPEVQLQELRRFCESRGWAIKEEICDHGFSGTSDNRPGLKRLFQLCRSRNVDAVIVTKLDRLFRSTKHLVLTLSDWQTLGIEFISLHDQIDATTASGRLMLSVISAFAEFEVSLIRERTMAGLAYARSQGKKLGRPPTVETAQILRLRSQGLTQREIQKQIGCSKGAVYRALACAPNSPQFSGAPGEGETNG